MFNFCVLVVSFNEPERLYFEVGYPVLISTGYLGGSIQCRLHHGGLRGKVGRSGCKSPS